MRNFIANEYGRTLVIHLGKGELMLESIQKALDEHGIKNAVLLSAIGSLRKLSMHIIMDTDDNATNNFVVVEKPFELCAMQGLVLNGVPHFHMVCPWQRELLRTCGAWLRGAVSDGDCSDGSQGHGANPPERRIQHRLYRQTVKNS